MPCAAILTCLFYGAISGSGPATTAAVGSMCIPFMVEMGYEKRWSAGLIAVAGGLGVIIPPSIPSCSTPWPPAFPPATCSWPASSPAS